MLDFLNKQLSNTEEELKDLFRMRANAGPESVGGIENRIFSLKKERSRLLKEIQELETIPPEESVEEKPNVTSEKVSKEQLIKEIRSLIANGKTKNAIEKIQANWDDNTITLLAARFNRINSQNNLGILPHADYVIELNRITNSLLNTLNDL
ncbi:MAG: hypothetical protein GY705_12840 [Bacteroidetes bacterium]|nr:hypothetical protein [Bacteroidota bacterium]